MANAKVNLTANTRPCLFMGVDWVGAWKTAMDVIMKLQVYYFSDSVNRQRNKTSM